MLKVGIVGLGTIGRALVQALDEGIAGLELAGITVRDPAKAAPVLAGCKHPPALLSLDQLVERVDIVADCAVAASFAEIATRALSSGRIFQTMNSGALLARPELFSLARETGARIVVPSGGIVGFDGFRALARGGLESVTLISRKPPESLAGAPHVVAAGYDLAGLAEPMRVFEGTAAEAAAAFPANANVAATLSMATLGPERTRVEMWADPDIDSIYQEILIVSVAARLRIEVRSNPMRENPRTGSLTPLSAIASLAALVPGDRIGS